MQNAYYPPPGAALGARQAPPQASASNSPLQKLGIALVALNLFILLSRCFDMALYYLHLPFLVASITLLLAFIAGDKQQLVHSRTARVLLFFLFWIGVATVFSTWPSGSAEVFYDCLTSCLFALCIIALATTPEDATRLMRVIAYSVLAAALFSFVFPGSVEGRLTLYRGTYADPNIYATVLLTGLPFWLMLSKKASMGPKKLLFWACSAVILYVFLRTGSRGGAIALLVMMVVYFFQASALQRLMIAVGGLIFVVAGVFLLPSYLQTRFVTIFNASMDRVSELDSRSQRRLDSDIASSESRFQLIGVSLRMTAQHPLFGVGPGQFAHQRWKELRVHSPLNPGLVVTHNAYTQISSETGIPGLVILLTVLYGSFKAAGRIRKLRQSPDYRVPPELLDAADYYRLSLTTLCVGSAFLSVAYNQFFWIMAGISAAYYHSIERSLPKWKVTKSAQPVENPGSKPFNLPPPPPAALKPTPGRVRLGGR